MAQYWNNAPGFTPNNVPMNNGFNTAWGGNPMPANPASIVPIMGRAAAEDYPVAPGAKVILVDVTNLVTYIKERDQQGRSLPFLTYEWVIKEDPISEPQPAVQAIDYNKIRTMISEEVNNAFSKQRVPKKEAK